MKKILLLASLAFILLSSFASADLDNVKSFTKNATDPYGTIKITNLFGLGSVLAEYKLIDNYDSVINTYAEGIVKINTPDQLFSDLQFKDFFGGQETIDSKIYINVTENYDVQTPIYREVCVEDKENVTTRCSNEIDSYITEKKQREAWKIYKGEILSSGTYKWKIEGKKGAINQKIDWIATAYGKELSEWAWWNTTFSYKKDLNVTGGSTTLDNFTVFINVTYTANMQADFDDLRFVDGACSGAQTTELSYELDYKTNSNSAQFWVKIPTLASGANQLCMYYGNAGVSTTSNGANAFDSNYTIVMHMSEDSGSFLKNSKDGNLTFMNLTGSSINWVAGIYGKAINLTGNNYARSVDSTIVLPVTWTTEVWVSTVGLTANRLHFNNMGGRGSNNFGMKTGQKGGQTGGCGNFNSAWNSNKNWNDILGAWYNGQCFSTNGVVGSTNVFQNKTDGFTDDGGGSGGAVGATGDWAIGYYEGSTTFGNSWYDEVKFSNNLRSSSWLNRSYDNVDYTLFNFGAEQVLDVTAPNVYLKIPLNNSISNNLIVFFQVNSTDETALTNATLHVWNVSGSLININTTTITGLNNVTNLSNTFSSDGVYYWNYRITDSSNNYAFNNSNFTITIDTTKPSGQFVNNTAISGSIITINNMNINVTGTDTNFVNITIRLYNASYFLNRSDTFTSSPANKTYTSLSDGLYYFNATITDLANNQNNTETRNITINTAVVGGDGGSGGNNQGVAGSQDDGISSRGYNLSDQVLAPIQSRQLIEDFFVWIKNAFIQYWFILIPLLLLAGLSSKRGR